MRDRWWPLVICGVLAAAVWAVFGQTRHHPFFNFDDDFNVYDNPMVREGLSLKSVAWAFTQSHTATANWHPLAILSHMADSELYGLNPAGHHLTNVLLHAATAVLLFLVLRNLTRALWPSAFVAAVFAIHPLRVESVAWVSERKDVLSGVFFVLTLWTYAKYVSGAKGKVCGATLDGKRNTHVVSAPGPLTSGFYWLSLMCFALGLLSKAMLVTVPFLLLLLDYWPLRRIDPTAGAMKLHRQSLRRVLLEKIPFLLLAGVSAVATIRAASGISMQSIESLEIPWRIGNALLAYGAYIGQMFYPAQLAVLYPHPGRHLPLWETGLALLILALITAGVLAAHRKRPYLLVGWLWYLGMLVPVIGLTQVGNQARADRFTYLPHIGLCLMIAWSAADLLRTRQHRRLVWSLGGAASLAGLLIVAHRQTGRWRDNITVWSHTLAVTSRNFLAHNNLGNALAAAGRPQEAMEQYELALRVKPDCAEAFLGLGNALIAQGKLIEAIVCYERALKTNPGLVKARCNLAAALVSARRLDEAVAVYEQALAWQPDLAEARFGYGIALVRSGRFDEGMRQYQRGLALRPDTAEFRHNLGNAFAWHGRLDEAVQHFQRVLELNPDHAEACNHLGVAFATREQFGEAVSYYKRALRCRPRYPEAHNNLGGAWAMQHVWTEAVHHYQQALEIKPDYVEARYNLGLALAAQGRTEESLTQFEQVAQLASAQGSAHYAENARARIEALKKQIASGGKSVTIPLLSPSGVRR